MHRLQLTIGTTNTPMLRPSTPSKAPRRLATDNHIVPISTEAEATSQLPCLPCRVFFLLLLLCITTDPSLS